MSGSIVLLLVLVFGVVWLFNSHSSSLAGEILAGVQALRGIGGALLVSVTIVVFLISGDPFFFVAGIAMFAVASLYVIRTFL